MVVWEGHLPFAQVLVEAFGPREFAAHDVELGELVGGAVVARVVGVKSLGYSQGLG